VIKNIDGLLEHVEINLRKRMDTAVIGLSGGADSTLVAILCTNALGKENVYGVHMPYNRLDNETFNRRSVILARHLGIPSKTVWIDNEVNLIAGNFGHLSELNQGNLRSRMRMVVLYTMCCEIAEQSGNEVRVIGTGNLSEDFIGYDTKGGDALADYFPIGSLVKSEVYQLLEYFRDQGVITEEMINRVPSAGLWDGQTDEDELGYTYDEMEPYVLDMYEHGQVDFNDPISKFVWERHKANRHKHEAPPVVALRGFCK